MSKRFGTDGIRGVANQTLDCETALRLGRAIATVLAPSGRPAHILVGKDPRRSSDMLEAALNAGLCSVGAHVSALGALPTPAVAYLTTETKADAGVMISASHNPAEYNGVKLFSSEGQKLPDETEDAIEAWMQDGAIPLASPERIGRIETRADAAERYIQRIRSTVDLHALQGMPPLRIALDCANGASAATAPRAFRFPNLELHLLHAVPDGDRINDNCGSTHLETLSGFVLQNKLDLGFAFDGDADRCLAVDEKGNPVNGDQLLALLASDMLARGALRNGVAGTVMSNSGFLHDCRKKGIPTVQTRVGDRHIVEEMRRSGKNIGGEPSGHIILSDYAPTGDGQLTALHVLALFCRARQKGARSFHELASEIPLYPQVLRNISANQKQKEAFASDPELAHALQLLEQEMHGDGRLLARASGTEDVIRVLAENVNRTEAERFAQRATELIEAAIKF